MRRWLFKKLFASQLEESDATRQLWLPPCATKRKLGFPIPANTIDYIFILFIIMIYYYVEEQILYTLYIYQAILKTKTNLKISRSEICNKKALYSYFIRHIDIKQILLI